MSSAQKHRDYTTWVRDAKNHGFKIGWASHKFKEKYHEWPPYEWVKEASEAKSPHDILGIKKSATREEVNKAYKDLVRKYHPDLVSNMGQEIRDVAEKMMKELNRAYEQLGK